MFKDRSLFKRRGEQRQRGKTKKKNDNSGTETFVLKKEKKSVKSVFLSKSDKHAILFICSSFILSLLTGIQRFEHQKEQGQRFLEKFLNV